MARLKYKALYQQALADQATMQYQRDVVQTRLNDINEALVPFGLQTLEAFEIPKGHGSIDLLPLPFVAARAFIESNQRFAADLDNGFVSYAWKGNPIIRRQP